MVIAKFFQKVAGWALPPTCMLCSAPAQQALDICPACEADLPKVRHACAKCAQPLPAGSGALADCGKCLQRPPPFERTVALFHYLAPVDYLIASLKFHHQLMCSRLLGELLSREIEQRYPHDEFPQCIIPVPLHQARLRERGFNQAVEIARPVAKRLKIPLDFTACERSRHTSAQSELPAKERYQNVKGAFRVIKKLTVKHVVILDDVVTTGHTVSELSRTLQAAGVARVDVWCCARTKEGFSFK